MVPVAAPTGVLCLFILTQLFHFTAHPLHILFLQPTLMSEVYYHVLFFTVQHVHNFNVFSGQRANCVYIFPLYFLLSDRLNTQQSLFQWSIRYIAVAHRASYGKLSQPGSKLMSLSASILFALIDTLTSLQYLPHHPTNHSLQTQFKSIKSFVRRHTNLSCSIFIFLAFCELCRVF